MDGKTLTTQEAWKKAAYYLTMCCGFPKDTKRKLFKAEQSFCQATNQHKIVFTLNIEHPVKIPTNKVLAEKAVEPVWAYYENDTKFDHSPFELLKDLIYVLETNCEAEHIERQASEAMRRVKEIQLLCDDAD